MSYKTDKLLSVFLYLVAIHSFVVGIGLIFLPGSVFQFLGFIQTFDRFFSTQGGVFHIAMFFAYAMAAYNLIKYKQLIVFSILVKFIATIFLLSYFIFISNQWLIILSGISDLIMAIITLVLYRNIIKENYFEKRYL